MSKATETAKYTRAVHSRLAKTKGEIIGCPKAKSRLPDGLAPLEEAVV
jgi:hypothetical protein